MAHWSEQARPLDLNVTQVSKVDELESMSGNIPAVYLFWFPAERTHADAIETAGYFSRIAAFCNRLHQESTVCFLATPPDAAALFPYLEKVLKFQLWIAVKANTGAYPVRSGVLPESHTALLVFTRYAESLRHTRTRIRYTYCPACGKTTKDYGGKKHTYHEYGTLMSDVWRDAICDPCTDIEPVVGRLSDLFGLPPYNVIQLIDLRTSTELLPAHPENSKITFTESPENHLPGLLPESTLVNGDCLEALRTIPDDSVDFCFTDPPYNLQKKYDKWNDALELIEYFAWCDRWLSELYRILKPGHTLAILNIPLWAVRHYKHLATIMDFQAWIVWEALGFPVRMIMPAHYAILCFSKGDPRPLPGLQSHSHNQTEREFLQPLAESYCLRETCMARRRLIGKADRSEINDLWSDIHRLKHNSRRVDHPCQLPPVLMRRLFALFTNPGEIIVDPFNGAGTTTLVAQQMKRRYIGIELSQKYHELALQRHERLKYGVDPFGKINTVPAAKNSPVQRLPKQKYMVSKKTLQLDVRRIARELGHLPTREEVHHLSRYPIDYFDRYFVSWGEVCAAARTTGMSELPEDQSRASAQLSLFAPDLSQKESV